MQSKNSYIFSFIPVNVCKAFCILFVICIFARSQLIFYPLYSMDSYSILYERDGYSTVYLMISQSRYGGAALWFALTALDVAGFSSAVLTLAVSSAMFCATGLILSTIILNGFRFTESLVFSAIFCLHPFMNEFFHFSDVTILFATSSLISAIGFNIFFLEKNSRVACKIFGIVMISFAISVYPTGVVYSLTAICLRFSDTTLIESKKIFELTLISILSAVVFFISARVISSIVEVPLDDHFGFSSLVRVMEKIYVIRDAAIQSLFPPGDFIRPAANALGLFLLAMSVVLIVSRNLRIGIGNALMSGVALGGAFLFAVGLTSLSDHVWLVPRTLSGYAVFLAGAIAMGWQLSRSMLSLVSDDRWLRRLAPAWLPTFALVVLAVSYVGTANRVIYEHSLANRWDQAETNRIVGRLEQIPAFATLKTVVMVGGHWERSSRLSTAWGNLNASAFVAPWAKLGLMEQATGYRFERSSEQSFVSALAYCKDRLPWPSFDSVTILEDVGVVCLRSR